MILVERRTIRRHGGHHLTTPSWERWCHYAIPNRLRYGRKSRNRTLDRLNWKSSVAMVRGQWRPRDVPLLEHRNNRVDSHTSQRHVTQGACTRRKHSVFCRKKEHHGIPIVRAPRIREAALFGSTRADLFDYIWAVALCRHRGRGRKRGDGARDSPSSSALLVTQSLV
jgi:hypothetical protein